MTADPDWNHVEIRSGGSPTPWDTTILLNGEPLNDVISVDFSISTLRPEVTRVTLTIEAKVHADLAGLADVTFATPLQIDGLTTDELKHLSSSVARQESKA